MFLHRLNLKYKKLLFKRKWCWSLNNRPKSSELVRASRELENKIGKLRVYVYMYQMKSYSILEMLENNWPSVYLFLRPVSDFNVRTCRTHSPNICYYWILFWNWYTLIYFSFCKINGRRKNRIFRNPLFTSL